MQKINNQILDQIEKILGEETSYQQTFGSMCTPPEDLSRQIAAKYAEINLGDPGLFPNSVKIEDELLAQLANILHAPDGWQGTVTSGGSEANLVGLWAARNWSRKNGKSGKKILLPKSVHVSLRKAADLLDLQPTFISLNSHFQINIDEAKRNIDDKTIALVGIAGTTGAGACDDVGALSDLAQEFDLFLHVDAAFGGLVFPFLKTKYSFDFENSGVCSIGVDSHKLLGSLIPCGSTLFRSEEYAQSIVQEISYLSGGYTTQKTITGTRPGSAVISAWALLKLMGRSYIQNRVTEAMEKTEYFVQKLVELPEVELAFDPTINIIGFRTIKMGTPQLIDILRQKGWHLSLYYDFARIVVMPHVTVKNIDKFINVLKNIFVSHSTLSTYLSGY